MSEDSSNQLPPAASKRTEITGEFFSVGAPLHAVRAGYVRRKADDLLYETVMSGRYAHVLAPDRSGKSSLIAATAARLESRGCKIAILDLEQIGVRDGGSDVLFRKSGDPVLRLITCGGTFDREQLSYKGNLVVTAVPV